MTQIILISDSNLTVYKAAEKSNPMKMCVYNAASIESE